MCLLILSHVVGDELEAGLLASGWGGDRYQVLGRAADALVWYTVWDDRVAADRFAKGLERAWRRRTAPKGLPDGRRSEIKRLVIGGRPAVGLVDAPAGGGRRDSPPRVAGTANNEGSR